MASNGILNDDLAQQLDDLSSDSETEYEADFRINALVKRAIRPDSQMFLLPEVSQSDLQLAAEAREAYYFVVNTTPTLFHNFVRDFYRLVDEILQFQVCKLSTDLHSPLQFLNFFSRVNDVLKLKTNTADLLMTPINRMSPCPVINSLLVSISHLYNAELTRCPSLCGCTTGSVIWLASCSRR